MLDASRSEVWLKSGSLWRLLPVKGIFRQVTGNSTVSAAGDVTGTITVAVKKHMGHVLGKLGAANRTEAVARARELSLIR